MKKIFIALISSVIFSNITYANSLRFVQVSDVHYANYRKNPYEYRMIENIKEILEDCVFQINKINLDFVVFTGDQIDFSEEENLKSFIETTNKLKHQWHFNFGNHDVYKYGNLTREKYLSIIKNNSKNCKTRTNYYSFLPKKGYLVIMLDSFEDGVSKPNGYIDKSQLKWLDKQLSKNKNKTVLIFTHDPIIPPFKHGDNNLYIYDHSMKNANEVISILKKYKNPIAVISGHYHVSKIIKEDNILYVNSPSLISYPNAYRIFDISIDERNVIFKISTKDTNLIQIRNKAKILLKDYEKYEGEDLDKNSVWHININETCPDH